MEWVKLTEKKYWMRIVLSHAASQSPKLISWLLFADELMSSFLYSYENNMNRNNFCSVVISLSLSILLSLFFLDASAQMKTVIVVAVAAEGLSFGPILPDKFRLCVCECFIFIIVMRWQFDKNPIGCCVAHLFILRIKRGYVAWTEKRDRWSVCVVVRM